MIKNDIQMKCCLAGYAGRSCDPVTSLFAGKAVDSWYKKIFLDRWFAIYISSKRIFGTIFRNNEPSTV